MSDNAKAIIVGCIILSMLMLVFNVLGPKKDAFEVAATIAPITTPIVQNYYLRGDGTWAATAMSGATATTPGSGGFVPPPQAGVNSRQFLRGDGTWQNSVSPYYYTTAAGAQPAVPVNGVYTLSYTGPANQNGNIMISPNLPNMSTFALTPGNTYKCTAGFSYMSGATNVPVNLYFWDNTNGAQIGTMTTTVPVPVMMGSYLSMGTTTLAYIPNTANLPSVSLRSNATADVIFYNIWMSVEVV